MTIKTRGLRKWPVSQTRALSATTRGVGIAALAALATGLSLAAPRAQDITDVANFKGSAESAYGAARGWNVVSGKVNGRFKYCAAERVIEGDPMRIGFDNAQWEFALPYKSRATYDGSIEVDGRKWDAMGASDGKWTFIWLDLRMLDSLRNGKEVIVELNRQSIERPLDGVAAAITKR